MDLDALEKALEKATPGPWKHCESCEWDDPKSCGYDSRESHRGAPYYATGPRAESSEQASNDAAAIVALMNAAPQLLAIAKAAEKFVGRVRNANEMTNGPIHDVLDSCLRSYDAATKGGG